MVGNLVDLEECCNESWLFGCCKPWGIELGEEFLPYIISFHIIVNKRNRPPITLLNVSKQANKNGIDWPKKWLNANIVLFTFGTNVCTKVPIPVTNATSSSTISLKSLITLEIERCGLAFSHHSDGWPKTLINLLWHSLASSFKERSEFSAQDTLDSNVWSRDAPHLGQVFALINASFSLNSFKENSSPPFGGNMMLSTMNQYWPNAGDSVIFDQLTRMQIFSSSSLCSKIGTPNHLCPHDERIY